jgi:hypothetical protein
MFYLPEICMKYKKCDWSIFQAVKRGTFLWYPTFSRSMFKLEFKVLEYIKVFKFWSLCIQNIVTGKIFDSKLLNQNGDSWVKIVNKIIFLQKLVQNVA